MQFPGQPSVVGDRRPALSFISTTCGGCMKSVSTPNHKARGLANSKYCMSLLAKWTNQRLPRRLHMVTNIDDPMFQSLRLAAKLCLESTLCRFVRTPTSPYSNRLGGELDSLQHRARPPL